MWIHKLMLPMLWQMHSHNVYERWSLFYQAFEISLQLAMLFILLKLLTFSGLTFSSRFQCQGILNFLFFFFLVSYTMQYRFLLLFFILLWTYTSVECFFLSPFIRAIYKDSVYIKVGLSPSKKNFLFASMIAIQK